METVKYMAFLRPNELSMNCKYNMGVHGLHVSMLWKFTRHFLFLNVWFVDSILFSDCRSQQRTLLTSHLLEETDKHRVETFGHPLPVQISERLTNKEGKSHVFDVVLLLPYIFCFVLN